ncbi:lipase family protein [Mangrovimicrobium sediminis]|uniref:Lipase family protein n=1 Tax=Mangrovimicrobium sediminis TaxID=2562682 RepID=A0A4Z0M5M5_9GAMM|nr:lipase family protein [Haliea sp. SAOS-164]TGD74799.1 lipase family protein [Haliea sp. SAOS-164]
MDTLDVFIGLISVYLTLALVVTALGQGASNWLNLKGRNARAIVVALLGRPLQLKLFQHPDIVKLSKSPGVFRRNFRKYFPGLATKQGEPECFWKVEPLRRPSYIPPEVFADALLDCLQKEFTETHIRAAVPTPGALQAVIEAYAALPAPSGVDSADGDSAKTAASAEIEGKGRLGRSLRPLWIKANFNVETFRAELVTWFEVTADRSYGWHKRQLGGVLFLVGLVVAVVMNADTVQMYKRLSQDQDLRAALVERALQLNEKQALGETCEFFGMPSGCSTGDIVRTGAADLLPVVGGRSVLEEWRLFECANGTADEPEECPGFREGDESADVASNPEAEAGEAPAADPAPGVSGQAAPPAVAAAGETGDGGEGSGEGEVDPQEEDPQEVVQTGGDTAGKPVGETASTGKAAKPEKDADARLWWLAKFSGLFLTAAAISLGAPFWFDLLNKVIQVRGAIRGHSEAGTAQAAAVPAASADEPAPMALASLVARTVDSSRLDTLSGFAVDDPGFSRLNMFWCARLSAAAYFDDAADRCDDFGAQAALLRHAPTSSECLVVNGGNFVILAFRGTEKKLADLETDLKYEPGTVATWDHLPPGCEVHGGFSRSLHALWHAESEAAPEAGKVHWVEESGSAPGETLLQRLDTLGVFERNLPVWITGHSLGGALAVLAAVELDREIAARKSGAAIAAVFTFGQPRVGNSAFARWMDQRFSQRYFRSVNQRDAVPRLPLTVMPNIHGEEPATWSFAHAGRVVYFNDLGRAIMDPPLWYRKLDAVPVAQWDQIGDALRQGAGDHGIAGYVELQRKLLESAEIASDT